MARIAAAVIWSAAEAAGAAGFAFVSGFVVARLVGPAALGIGTAAVSLHVVLWVFVNALFADALVQRAALDAATEAGTFWASVLVGCGAAALMAACGVPLAWAFADSRLHAMALVLALPLPLVGAGGAVQGRLMRDGRYRLLALRTLLGQGLGTLVGCVAAWRGAGAWAVVAQQAVGAAAGALVLLTGGGWRPAPRRPVWSLLRVGLPLTASTLVLHGRYRVFLLLLGAGAGARVLGQVHMAFRLVEALRELASTALWRLLLPAFSARQDDPAALHAAMLRAQRASLPALLGLCVALALALRPVTALLLGPAWAGAGTAALPLVGLAAWQFIAFAPGAALVARGVPSVALRANLASLALLVAGAWLLRPSGALAAIWIWVGAQLIVAPYALIASGLVLRMPARAMLRAAIPGVALAAVAGAAGWAVPGVGLGGATVRGAVVAIVIGIGWRRLDQGGTHAAAEAPPR